MEIFIAPSIKSFDLNPTHPGPLPRASFHTSANQKNRTQRKQGGERACARSATNEVGARLQKSASGEQDELTKAGDMLQGQKVVASFCAQGARKLRPLRSASRSSLNGLASESRPSENERPRFFDCRKWKTTARPRKTLPGSLDRGRAKSKWKCSEAPFVELRGYCKLPSCVCDSRRLRQSGRAAAGHRSCGGAAAPAAHVAGKRACPTLDSSSKKDLETCGKHRELKRKLSTRAPTQRKARAREEPSPGPPASETDARPLGHQPRGGAPARPTVQPRPRRPDLESAQV